MQTSQLSGAPCMMPWVLGVEWIKLIPKHLIEKQVVFAQFELLHFSIQEFAGRSYFSGGMMGFGGAVFGQKCPSCCCLRMHTLCPKPSLSPTPCLSCQVWSSAWDYIFPLTDVNCWVSHGRIWIATTWVISSRKEGALRAAPLRAGRRRRRLHPNTKTQIKMGWREWNGRGLVVKISISPENRTSAKPGLDWPERGTRPQQATLNVVSHKDHQL